MSRQQLPRRRGPTALVAVLVLGLVGGALWVVIAAVAGKDDLITGYSARIVVLAAIYDALLAVVIFPFVHWACGNHDLARR